MTYRNFLIGLYCLDIGPLVFLSKQFSKVLPLYKALNRSSCTVLKGVFAKNERGYRLNAINATNLTSICCVYKEKLVKNDSHRRTQRPYKFRKMKHST